MQEVGRRTNCACPGCAARQLRPDIVWFGEMPYHRAAIDAALDAADLFVSIGTSGAVYPAAGFVDHARAAGARTLEINLDASAGTPLFDESRRGPASRRPKFRRAGTTTAFHSLGQKPKTTCAAPS